MTEISYIKVKTQDMDCLGVPFELIETVEERIILSKKYIHKLTEVKNWKTEEMELRKKGVKLLKELNDIKHPDK